MTKVSVIEVVALVRFVQQETGKAIKETLDLLEQEDSLNPKTRKIILDKFNGLARSINRALGYNVEV